MLTRSAALSRIAPGGFRNARTRTCICSKPHSPGSPSKAIRAGAAWRMPLPPFAWRSSLIRGALGEFFAADWSPAPGVEGRIREPGHQYEWAFLLDRWVRLTARKPPEAAPRLIAFDDSRGLNPRRGVAVNAVLADGGIHDPVARLWPHAERIRAYLAQRRSKDEVAAAIKGLRRFLATPTEGVWFDQLGADNVFILEPARATSLYHIIGAVAELSAASGGWTVRGIATRRLRRLLANAMSRVGGRLRNIAPTAHSVHSSRFPGRHFPASRRLPWQYRFWRCAAVIFVLASIAACGWLVREPVLLGSASLWIVSDPVSRANAIVVLGGGLVTRPFEAAELWRRGLADKILVSQAPEERAASMDAMPSHTELNREILVKLGVPPGAIETFGAASKNTRDEAVALREWAERNAASVFIIPSEIFSARRVRWIFRHEFFSTDVSIEVPAVEPLGYTRSDWWKTEQGLLAFQNEFLKYIYYRWKY